MRLILVLFLIIGCDKTPKPIKPPTSLPSDFIGVTIDEQSEKAASALALHKKKLWARIVFDEYEPAKEYVDFVNLVASNNPVMGEILDSYYLKEYSLPKYQKRVREYVSMFSKSVSLWEIGNEVNGEWTGSGESVAAKVESAFNIVKDAGGLTSLTLYYNKGCWGEKDHEMYTWVNKYLSDKIKNGIDYVLVSYYEDDCKNQEANWPEIIKKVGDIFPNAKLGIGECGPGEDFMKKNPESKWNVKEILKQYYTMEINHHRFVGGYFYWYYVKHMKDKGEYWKYLEGLL